MSDRGKDDSRKGAKDAKFGEIGRYLSLRAWRLGLPARLPALREGFQPGGALDGLLDGSTIFRRPGAGETVFGRSWAIHDGILGNAWVSPNMIKWFGVDAAVCTFPGYRSA